MTENSLILLYCIVDDFIQRFIRAEGLIPRRLRRNKGY